MTGWEKEEEKRGEREREEEIQGEREQWRERNRGREKNGEREKWREGNGERETGRKRNREKEKRREREKERKKTPVNLDSGQKISAKPQGLALEQRPRFTKSGFAGVPLHSCCEGFIATHEHRV